MRLEIRRANLARRTRQYNPATAGAESLGQWLNAVLSLRGEGGTMSVADAVAMVHATPASDRSRFAREIWDRRRSRYGSKGRQLQITLRLQRHKAAAHAA
jgi:hypothetical protein